MRVGFYIGAITPEELGGGSIFQINILNLLKNFNTDHKLYFFYYSENNLFEDTDCIKFVNMFFEKKTTKKTFKYRLKKIFNKKEKAFSFLDELVKKYQIELVYFYNVQYQKVSIPYIITVWDISHRETPFFPEVSVTQWTYDERENFYNEILPKAARIVIGNEEGRQELCHYYNLNQDLIETIPMITPTDVYSLNADNTILERLNLTPQKYLYYPAQFWSHKNHIRLLKELKKLKLAGYNLKLVFTGSDQGNEKYIVRKTKELGLDSDVIFAGFLKREEVIALYKNAYALTYASYFGPDNIPPLEAMALGCPVLCSEFAGAHEQLQDCALFFNHVTGDNFIESIKQLQDNNFREHITNKAKVLSKQYSTENYVSKMFKIIDEFENIRECWGNIYNE